MLPSISIVVPNYNGAATLAQTLQCLIDQQYPGLEILVVDGGSSDNSVEIIKQFEPHLAWWISEKDSGQSNAINKGFARCKGEIVNWLCSDDLLTDGALKTVGEAFANQPETDVLVGACEFLSLVNGMRRPWDVDARRINLMPCCNPIPQSSCFYRRGLLRRDPPLDESYHFAMDFELWCYFRSQGARFKTCPQVLSIFQTSDSNKTTVGGEKIVAEIDRLYRTYAHERVPLTFWHRYFRYPVERLRQSASNPALVFLTRCYTGLFSRAFGLVYGYDRVKSMNWEWMVQ